MGNESSQEKNSDKECDKAGTTVKEENEPLKNRGLDSLSADLKEAFLREEDCDITIKIGELTFSAHSFILKHRSPIFKGMLKYDTLDKNQGIIHIEDCDPSKFREFLLYLYTGKLDDLSKENVFKLYHLSDKFNVTQLKKECANFILNNLNNDTICDVIVLATTHAEYNMLARAGKFFVINVKDILPTPQWQKFITENPTIANELLIKSFSKEKNRMQ